MKEKQPVKINLHTAIFLIIILMLSGGLIYFIFQNSVLKSQIGQKNQNTSQLQTQELQEPVNKTIDSTSNTVAINPAENAISDAPVNTVESTIDNTISNTNKNEKKESDDTKYTESLDTSKQILDEIKEKRFLAKNNIFIDSKIKYVVLTHNKTPFYLIHVEHEDDSDGNRFTYFFATIKNGQVSFRKIFQHKYEYDLFYEEDSLSIKLEASYRQYNITKYGIIKDLEYLPLDEFYEPATSDTSIFTLNGKEVSSKDFEKAKKKYNKQYKKFSDAAIEL